MANLLFAFALLTALSPPTPSQSAAAPPPPAASAPAPVENSAITAMALKIYAQMRAGKVDDALLTRQMQAAATPELLAQTKPMFDTLGDPKDLKLEAVTKIGDATNYTYLAIFPTAQFHISILITPEGKVGGYLLKP